MGSVSLWASLRDSFLLENKDELKTALCELYQVDPETFHTRFIILVDHKKDKGVMYLCPISVRDAHGMGNIPVKDLTRVGTMSIDYSEPCLVYELDDFDNSLL